MLNKTNTSEGDVAHATATARTVFAGATGAGAKVGVLSDSVDALAALQASGDLPLVTVLPGQSGVPGTSEGTAMLEIVYDLAPGADLLFATASGGQAQFATNIGDLAAAGADVIVDDAFYLAEAAFQDGVVAQAVQAFTDAGGLYFSSAGNSGNLNDGTSGVWEGDFSSAPPPAGLAAYCGGGPCDTADFSGGSSLNSISAGSPSFFTLRWSDPLGASANDCDLIPIGVREVFGVTALDIEAVGRDRDSGLGLLDGLTAVGAVSPTGSCSCGLPAQACPAELYMYTKPNTTAAPGVLNLHLPACAEMNLGYGDFTGVSGTASQIIFTDGFESGDTSVWSNGVP